MLRENHSKHPNISITSLIKEMISEDKYESVVLSHYENDLVKREIARFSRGRWVAIHCQTLDRSGRPYLLRYLRKARRKIPLTIESPDDVASVIERFKKLKPKTFYASISIYSGLNTIENVKDLGNIAYCLPTWDIDNKLEKWKATVETANIIVEFLKSRGIENSIFLKWSGNGMHVHIHHRAFSEYVLEKVHPLDIAYSVVEYVNSKLQEKYRAILQKHEALKLRVENKVDMQRVFTSPLSLHRKLNTVAVCINPKDLKDFSPAWVMVNRFKHWGAWDNYEEGEADNLALNAYKTVGGYPLKRLPTAPKRRKTKLDELILKWISQEEDESQI